MLRPGLFVKFAKAMKVDCHCHILPGLDDGAGHQLGEKGDIQRHVHKAFLRPDLAPVHIDGIAEGLEGVEADAHRQQDVQTPRPGNAEKGAEGVHKEVEVLEDAQNHQGHDHAHSDPKLFPIPLISGGAAIGHQGQAQHQKAAFPVPPAVEHIAGQEQQHMPQGIDRPGQQGLDFFHIGQGHHRADDGKEDRKERRFRRRNVRRGLIINFVRIFLDNGIF